MSRAAMQAPALADTGAVPVSALSGVGPKVAGKLAARGLGTLGDLWLHLPRQYEDRTRVTPIRYLRGGVPAQVEGIVEAVEKGFRRRPMLRVAIGDGSGGSLVLRFFHFRAAQVAQLAVGTRVCCFGTPRPGQQGLEFVHPSYRVLDDGAVTVLDDSLDPVYPAIDGVGPQVLRRLVGQALDRLPDAAALELLPRDALDALDLPTLRDALLYVHRPPADADLGLLASGRHPAQRRLVFEEMLAHHLSLRRQRIALQAHRAPALRPGALTEALRAALPFALTGAQVRVLRDVSKDLVRRKPMLRLVQGDVGSGKTVVAALAAAASIDSGCQAALMAPTELLAEQHAQNLRGWFEPLGIRVAWLAGKVTGRARTAVLDEIASGAAQLVVGTHALMQANVVFHDLALAIIDEQHRFGVHQRLALRDKGAGGDRVPHQLVMTATPIPRTLAMSAYADLDVSAIDELPPGRTPVQTVVLSSERRPALIERIRHACAEGRQAYWVCTLIDDSDEVVAQAAQTTFEQLTAALPGLRVALVHGRLKAAEKQRAMQAFKAGDVDLLVATTVIEVGVDVPNATVMVILDADRFGIAQLHQLRGRVGRGAHASRCWLVTGEQDEQNPRVEALVRSTDGFELAEVDLELRGEGTIM
ncbi:MAG: ATP-dependent DNA helicase RecG, partial [Luteimonas sp.]